MSKDPTPKADGLQAMREARYGHIQATAEPKIEKLERVRKLIPFAGKETKGIAPAAGPRSEAAKARAAAKAEAKKARKRVKHKRRTELPPEGDKL
jgi:hypothetical protein